MSEPDLDLTSGMYSWQQYNLAWLAYWIQHYVSWQNKKWN